MTQTEKRGRVPYLDWVRGMSRRLNDLRETRDQLDDPEEREQVDALIASIEMERHVILEEITGDPYLTPDEVFMLTGYFIEGETAQDLADRLAYEVRTVRRKIKSGREWLERIE